ncbi:MAG: hypothetical protein KAJ13_01525 [Gemmatimonadetes bacterium]|nr:hypothetical protein [Gemmatimonadota bacterium]
MARSAAPSVHHCFASLLWLGAVLVLLAPATAGAQSRDRDARIPRAGSLWLEFSPEFYSWSEQFAENSPVVEDGRREPLFANYDGSVASRLFPGVDPLLDIVNRDSDALGFTPLTEQQLSLGEIDFNSIDVFVRRIPLSLQFGIGGFAAIEMSAPLVKTEVETGFSFDSATANILRAETALADPSAFFAELDAAQGQLQSLVDGGALSPEESATAVQLLSDTEAFQGALGARISNEEYLFTSGSSAGQEMTGYYGGFEAGFQTFGITLPGFGLPVSATRPDLNAYFERDPVLGQPLGKVTRGWAFSEIEVGVRFKLLDTFGWPERPEKQPTESEAGRAGPPHDLPAGAPEEAEEEPANEGEDVQLDPAAAGEQDLAVPEEQIDPGAVAVREPPPLDRQGVRFRTTVGARYRFPLSDPDEAPYLDPDVFLQQPIGDGQADVELELYQDIAFGQRFLVVAGATYGIQLQDELVRRVVSPDQRYGLESQTVTVTRDLGDFFEIVISPRFALAEAMSLAIEYTFWNKKSDTYEISSGGVDASPLELETSQTRHSLGIGAYYRTTRLFAAGRAGLPIDLAVLWQTSIAGSGGQTPSAGVLTVSARVPIQLF